MNDLVGLTRVGIKRADGPSLSRAQALGTRGAASLTIRQRPVFRRRAAAFRLRDRDSTRPVEPGGRKGAQAGAVHQAESHTWRRYTTPPAAVARATLSAGRGIIHPGSPLQQLLRRCCVSLDRMNREQHLWAQFANAWLIKDRRPRVGDARPAMKKAQRSRARMRGGRRLP